MGIKPGRCGQISIHAPRTGSDFISFSSHLREGYFNPRSPHGERRRARLNPRLSSPFQSTLPARGATSLGQIGAQGGEISIHAPRTGSDEHGHKTADGQPISIHAPRTGSDAHAPPSAPAGYPFQSTLPARGATAMCAMLQVPPLFQSTLPARGATWTCCRSSAAQTHFNPRSPHGERPIEGINWAGIGEFQSTLPARGATPLRTSTGRALVFQSTLPARGATDRKAPSTSTRPLFQSTLPARGATEQREEANRRARISIHAPRTGSDFDFSGNNG